MDDDTARTHHTACGSPCRAGSHSIDHKIHAIGLRSISAGRVVDRQASDRLKRFASSSIGFTDVDFGCREQLCHQRRRKSDRAAAKHGDAGCCDRLLQLLGTDTNGMPGHRNRLS